MGKDGKKCYGWKKGARVRLGKGLREGLRVAKKGRVKGGEKGQGLRVVKRGKG